MRNPARILTVLAMTVLLIAIALPASAASTTTPPTPPVRTIPVTGNNLIAVTSGVASNFVMKDGDAVMFPSLKQSKLKTAIAAETGKTLPASIPEDMVFLDALSVSVVDDGEAVDTLPEKGKITVSFAHDAEYGLCDGDGALAVLRWDETKGWTEIAANTLNAVSNAPGFFALVRR